RKLGPVVSSPSVGRVFITNHGTVSEAEHTPEVIRSYSETNLTMVRALGTRPMRRKDDPDNATEHSAINPTLRPRPGKNLWDPKFADTVNTWIDHLVDVCPETADVNVDFAAPIASQNLIDLVGFPDTVDVEDMRRWSLDFIAGTGNILDDPAIWRRCDT